MEPLNTEDTMSIINYGVNIQNMISELSECAFNVIRKVELKDISELLSELIGFITSDDTAGKTFSEKEKYIDTVSDRLREYRIELLKDCELFEQLCAINRVYINELIQRINYAKEQAAMMKSQALTADGKMRLSTLEKRIGELEMTQTVAYSFEPQLKVVQENESQMSEKIQSVLVNALALWKRQQITNENKESILDTNELIMQGINELIRLQREGYSLIDKG